MASTTSFTEKGVEDWSDIPVRTRKKVGASASAVAARILAILSANERQMSSALIAEECGELPRPCRTLIDDQSLRGSARPASNRSDQNSAKPTISRTRRPSRCRIKQQQQRNDTVTVVSLRQMSSLATKFGRKTCVWEECIPMGSVTPLTQGNGAHCSPFF